MNGGGTVCGDES